MLEHIKISPIGYIQSPYKQKFAIPRQPNLVPEAQGTLLLTGEFNHDNYIRGLEEFSHLWLLFQFHENADKGYSSLVRPPRLGGNTRKGVFATRATFRPNGLGMSVVKLHSICKVKNQISIILTGIDLLDKTPVIDIKPYLPYSDSHPDASAGFADNSPHTFMTVDFSNQALTFIENERHRPELKHFITNVLKQDPRPSYKKKHKDTQSYGVNLYEYNIKWTVQDNHNYVSEITRQ